MTRVSVIFKLHRASCFICNGFNCTEGRAHRFRGSQADCLLQILCHLGSSSQQILSGYTQIQS